MSWYSSSFPDNAHGNQFDVFILDHLSRANIDREILSGDYKTDLFNKDDLQNCRLRNFADKSLFMCCFALISVFSKLIGETQLSSTPFINRRRSPRKRVLFCGVIVYGGGRHFYKCIIRYASTHGARITIPKGQPLPSEVDLINLSNPTGHKANVAWRKGVEAGLAFLSSFDLQATADTGPTYLKKIWLAYTYSDKLDNS